MSSRTITVNIPHRHTQEEARSRLQKGVADMKQQFAGKIVDVHDTWSGNVMNFRLGVMGQAVTGRVEVLAESVKVDVDLPWLLAMLADRIKPQVEREGRKMLE